MVMMVRDELIKGDFSTCLRLLQSYPPANVDTILHSSRTLWIYETQINLACHKGGITLNQALHAIRPPDGIIMAFGLRGGVAPTLSDQIHDAAAAVEQTTTGLLGRAKQLWKARTTTSIDSSVGQESTTSSTANNNGEAGSNGTVTQNSNGESASTVEEAEEEDIAPPSGDETAAEKARRLWKGIQTGDTSDIPVAAAAASSSINSNTSMESNNNPHPPVAPVAEERVGAKVGRLWKAWRAPAADSTTTTTVESEKSGPSSSLSLPNKPRAWNRGRTELYGRTSAEKTSAAAAATTTTATTHTPPPIVREPRII
jgi:hypothetical protein